MRGNFAVQLSAGRQQCMSVPFKNVTSAETRMLWMQTTSRLTSGLFSSWLDTGSLAVSIELRMVQGQLQAYVFSGSAGYVVDAGTAAAAPAVNDGKWHHVAMVRSGGSLALYIDGTLILSAGSRLTNRQFMTLSARIDSVAVGCRAVGSSLLSPLYFDGLMDDVRHYSAALDAVEVASICTLEWAWVYTES